MSAVIHPDDFAPSAALLEEQLLRGDTIQLEHRVICRGGAVKWVSIKAQLFRERGEEQYFYCVFVDVTDERRLRDRVRELYEEELAYFSELASREGSIQGTINVSRDRLESYQATLDVAVAHVGDTYVKTIQNLSGSAVDAAYGVEIRRMLARGKVLEDYAAGKVDYRPELPAQAQRREPFLGQHEPADLPEPRHRRRHHVLLYGGRHRAAAAGAAAQPDRRTGLRRHRRHRPERRRVPRGRPAAASVRSPSRHRGISGRRPKNPPSAAWTRRNGRSFYRSSISATSGGGLPDRTPTPSC